MPWALSLSTPGLWHGPGRRLTPGHLPGLCPLSELSCETTDGESDSVSLEAWWEPRMPSLRLWGDRGRCEQPGEAGEEVGRRVCLGEGRDAGAGPSQRAASHMETHMGDTQCVGVKKCDAFIFPSASDRNGSSPAHTRSSKNWLKLHSILVDGFNLCNNNQGCALSAKFRQTGCVSHGLTEGGEINRCLTYFICKRKLISISLFVQKSPCLTPLI